MTGYVFCLSSSGEVQREKQLEQNKNEMGTERQIRCGLLALVLLLLLLLHLCFCCIGSSCCLPHHQPCNLPGYETNHAFMERAFGNSI
jgi:hypothetical protein